MDIIAHEERLLASGFNLEQAREILRVVTSGDAQAMTRADGDRLESSLTAQMKRLEQSFHADVKRLEQSSQADIKRLEHSSQADIKRLEQSSQTDIKRLEDKIDAKLEAAIHRLTSTVWTAVGIAAATLVALTKLGELFA